jgi:hypothetical protein
MTSTMSSQSSSHSLLGSPKSPAPRSPLKGRNKSKVIEIAPIEPPKPAEKVSLAAPPQFVHADDSDEAKKLNLKRADPLSVRTMIVRAASDVMERLSVLMRVLEYRAPELWSIVSVEARNVTYDTQKSFEKLLSDLPDDNFEIPTDFSCTDVDELHHTITALRHNVLNEILSHKATRAQCAALEARALRREESFTYIRQELQKEICMLQRALSGNPTMAQDPNGLFATIDVMLLLSEAKDDRNVAEMLQDLIGLLKDEENQRKVGESRVISSLQKLSDAKAEVERLQRQVQAISQRSIEEVSKMRLLQIQAERQLSRAESRANVLSVENAELQRKLHEETEQCKQLRADNEAMTQQIEMMDEILAKEKNNLLVQVASLSMKLHAEQQKARRKWTVDPETVDVEFARLIAMSGKVPESAKKTDVLARILNVTNRPDDPRKVATVDAMKERLLVLSKEMELWKEEAITVATEKNRAAAKTIELEEDITRIQGFAHDHQLELVPLAAARTEASKVNTMSHDVDYRPIVRTYRADTAVSTRRLRVITDQIQAVIAKKADPNASPAAKALDPDASDSDSLSGEDEDSRLGGVEALLRAIDDLEKTSVDLKLRVQEDAHEIRSLVSSAAISDLAHENERELWLEDWMKLVAQLPPALAARINVDGVKVLKNEKVKNLLQQIAANAQSWVEAQNEEVFETASIPSEDEAEASSAGDNSIQSSSTGGRRIAALNDAAILESTQQQYAKFAVPKQPKAAKGSTGSLTTGKEGLAGGEKTPSAAALKPGDKKPVAGGGQPAGGRRQTLTVPGSETPQGKAPGGKKGAGGGKRSSVASSADASDLSKKGSNVGEDKLDLSIVSAADESQRSGSSVNPVVAPGTTSLLGRTGAPGNPTAVTTTSPGGKTLTTFSPLLPASPLGSGDGILSSRKPITFTVETQTFVSKLDRELQVDAEDLDERTNTGKRYNPNTGARIGTRTWETMTIELGHPDTRGIGVQTVEESLLQSTSASKQKGSSGGAMKDSVSQTLGDPVFDELAAKKLLSELGDALKSQPVTSGTKTRPTAGENGGKSRTPSLVLSPTAIASAASSSGYLELFLCPGCGEQLNPAGVADDVCAAAGLKGLSPQRRLLKVRSPSSAGNEGPSGPPTITDLADLGVQTDAVELISEYTVMSPVAGTPTFASKARSTHSQGTSVGESPVTAAPAGFPGPEEAPAAPSAVSDSTISVPTKRNSVPVGTNTAAPAPSLRPASGSAGALPPIANPRCGINSAGPRNAVPFLYSRPGSGRDETTILTPSCSSLGGSTHDRPGTGSRTGNGATAGSLSSLAPLFDAVVQTVAEVCDREELEHLQNKILELEQLLSAAVSKVEQRLGSPMSPADSGRPPLLPPSKRRGAPQTVSAARYPILSDASSETTSDDDEDEDERRRTSMIDLDSDALRGTAAGQWLNSRLRKGLPGLGKTAPSFRAVKVGKKKKQQSGNSKRNKSPNAYSSEDEYLQHERELAEKEQMLRRSLSPPHPAFHSRLRSPENIPSFTPVHRFPMQMGSSAANSQPLQGQGVRTQLRSRGWDGLTTATPLSGAASSSGASSAPPLPAVHATTPPPSLKPADLDRLRREALRTALHQMHSPHGQPPEAPGSSSKKHPAPGKRR